MLPSLRSSAKSPSDTLVRLAKVRAYLSKTANECSKYYPKETWLVIREMLNILERAMITEIQFSLTARENYDRSVKKET
jgi:hypothetical protein